MTNVPYTLRYISGPDAPSSVLSGSSSSMPLSLHHHRQQRHALVTPSSSTATACPCHSIIIVSSSSNRYWSHPPFHSAGGWFGGHQQAPWLNKPPSVNRSSLLSYLSFNSSSIHHPTVKLCLNYTSLSLPHMRTQATLQPHSPRSAGRHVWGLCGDQVG